MPRTTVSTPRTIASSRLLIRDMTASFNFDGTTGYVSRNASNVYGSTGYSVSFWVKATRATDKRLYSEGSSASTNPTLFIGSGNSAASNDTLSIFIRNDAGTIKLNFVKSVKPVFDSQWHHVIWTDNNGTCALYIDGVADATNFNYSQSGTYTMDRTALGANVRTTVTNFFAGLARGMKTYTTALTAAQALQLYLTGNVLGVAPNIEWTGNEGVGSLVVDASGNGNNGTITGGVTYSTEVPMKARQAATTRSLAT